MLDANEFREAIAHVSTGMNKRDFEKVFTDNGYYWQKFCEEFNKEGARFICYLDSWGLQRLVNYLNMRHRVDPIGAFKRPGEEK